MSLKDLPRWAYIAAIASLIIIVALIVFAYKSCGSSETKKAVTNQRDTAQRLDRNRGALGDEDPGKKLAEQNYEAIKSGETRLFDKELNEDKESERLKNNPPKSADGPKNFADQEVARYEEEARKKLEKKIAEEKKKNRVIGTPAPAEEVGDGEDGEVGADGAEVGEGKDGKDAPPSDSKTKSKSKKKKKKGRKLKPAILEVFTNFAKADVTVNGLAYPEYTEPGKQPGVVLPAGGPYDVQVTYDGKVKRYEIFLKPYETRSLVVDLTGFMGKSPTLAIPITTPPKNGPADLVDLSPEKGVVHVYSTSNSRVLLDGKEVSPKTPTTFGVPPGSHKVKVIFSSGKVSEPKTVRSYPGSKVKLYFRE